MNKKIKEYISFVKADALTLYEKVTLKTIAYVLLGLGALVLCLGLFATRVIAPDAGKIISIQPFIAGLVVPLFTLGSTLLLIENLRASTLQNFSNNFFKLIDFHHKAVDNIEAEILDSAKPSKGRKFFDDLSERIERDFKFLDKRNKSTTEATGDSAWQENFGKEANSYAAPVRNFTSTGEQLLKDLYNYYYHIHHGILGQYFTQLYRIVKFVDTHSRPNDEEKRTYLKMLRAQLSNYEVLILAYNCIHPFGAKKFKPLVERYEMLKLLSNEDFIPEDERRIIDPAIIQAAFVHLQKDDWADLEAKEVHTLKD